MKIVAIIQARMGSKRLPGKVLMPILHTPLLGRLVERVKRARLIDQIVVATSDLPQDDAIADFVAQTPEVFLFRGDELDVLKRFAGAIQASDAAVVMRITADNPFFDWVLADEALQGFVDGEIDYLSTPDYPYGIAMEVFSAKALLEVDREARDPYDREHVTAFFYRNPERFKIGEQRSPQVLSHVRLTVDTREDLTRAQQLFERFGDNVTFREVVDAEG
ncbi:MAG: acylneuraminate cytidylyltransferase [Desulfuromonas sp.]|nr:MAG: acylneuraminate cytidylyltransferase [Desulfuromonas sp.]